MSADFHGPRLGVVARVGGYLRVFLYVAIVNALLQDMDAGFHRHDDKVGAFIYPRIEC